MIIEKKTVIYVETELEIKGATLLSVDEVEALPLRLRKYNNWWWLRSPSFFSFYAALVDDDGSVDYYGSLVLNVSVAVVRPVLQIRNLESSNFEVGDVFKFGNKEFEIISDTLAFCLTDIGKHKFDPKSKDYEQSEIKQCVDKWFEQSKKVVE